MIHTGPTYPPSSIRPMHAWVLVREDPDPTVTPGGLIIPGTSEYQGRRNVKATVIRSGPGRDKSGRLWEMPAPGSRIFFPILAHKPDTQVRIMSTIFDPEHPDARHYLVHASDTLGRLDPEYEGEPEPRVE